MRTTEEVIQKWKPTPENPICHCAGKVTCAFCELTEWLQAEANNAAEAQAALVFAVDECTSHSDRFLFISAIIKRDEVALLKYPSWLSKREQIRAAASHAPAPKLSEPSPDYMNRYRL